MRTLSLLPAVFLALHAFMPAAAVPVQMSKVESLPVLGDLTLGAIGPTQVPNPNLPGLNVPGVPHRRSHNDRVNIHPRQVHSADFSSSPNSTVPAAPVAASRKRTTLDKREPAHIFYSKPKSSTSDLVMREIHDSKSDTLHENDAAGIPSADPAAAVGQLTSTFKSVGSAQKKLSSVTNKAPVTLPDTPITSADTGAVDAATQAAAKEASKSPKSTDESKSPHSANPDAYPHVEGYDYSKTSNGAAASASASAPQKRHSFVLDTDPILPPSDTTGKDPSMGVANLDSNRKPEDNASKVPVAPKTIPTGDVPDVPAPTGSNVPAAAAPASGAVSAAPVPATSPLP